MDFGNLLDTLLLCKKADFDKRFIMTEVKKPSDNLVAITTGVYAEIQELNTNAEAINNAAPGDDLFQKGVKIPMKEIDMEKNADIVKKHCLLNKFWEKDIERAYKEALKGKEYFEFLKKVGKKTVIDKEQLTLAEELRDKIINDPISRPFFMPKKGCEVMFQQQIFGEYELAGFENVEMMPVKGMLDIIHINHTKKQIREVDLKFTNDAFQFYVAIKRFDYALQHSFYKFLLELWIETFDGGKYKDYQIMNPLNVVIDDREKIPYLYCYNSMDLAIKRNGIENTKIIGWESNLLDIAWHMDQNKWDRPKSHYLTGFLSVEIFNNR